MKSLLCHCKNYESEVTGLSDRPEGIISEKVTQDRLQIADAVVALITVEIDDVPNLLAPQLTAEIRKMCSDTGHKRVVLLPFAHLSSSLADSETSMRMIDAVAKLLADLSPARAHFGSDKRLNLDIYGHPGNVRFRAF
jgi:threonyl-tRNA synthetase